MNDVYIPSERERLSKVGWTDSRKVRHFCVVLLRVISITLRGSSQLFIALPPPRFIDNPSHACHVVLSIT